MVMEPIARTDTFGRQYRRLHHRVATTKLRASLRRVVRSRLRTDESLRIVGSLLIVVGWFVVLNTSVTIGSLVSLTGDCLAVPYFVRTRAWDVVIMIALLHSVTVHKVAQALFTWAGS